MAMPSSSPPPDPPPPAAANTATTTRPLFANPPPPPQQSTNHRPPPPLPPAPLRSNAYPPPPQASHPHPHHHLYPAQPRLSTTAASASVAANQGHPQLPTRPHDILYPVASSGRGYIPRPTIRPPQSNDQTVTIANSGGVNYRSAAVAGYPHHSHPHPHPPQAVRPYGFAYSEPNLHMMRNPHLQHTLVGPAPGVMPSVVKGVPVSGQHSKVAPSPSSLSDNNGHKDLRDRSRDDTLATVRDRKVRITDGASLYALCRSWLKNGFPEESQPPYNDGVKSLPRPLPLPVGDAHSPSKKEDDKEEEVKDEKNIEQLSPKELLQIHVKRARKVRARLREERLRRIARYKTRLALLLPPFVEQQYRNET